ncbi:MAG: hypothetical protein K9L60_07425 [Methylovulum sp.]|jgi:hypothetical protein|nr:hypothetical protein [Methylovulum sp.]MCF7999030.1 hypothetical protein [Methylovulum sp.]
MNQDFALLLLESPWWLPRDNPLRATCLPFFQGLERLYDGFNIYYSTFYDTAGFETALSEDLIHTVEKRQILYIGAHGNHGSIANGRASTLLGKVSQHGKRIEGVIISSCLVASRENNLLNVLASGDVRWVFGYTKSVDWLSSLLLELAIVEALVRAPEDVDHDREALLDTFKTALEKFNPNAPFGADGEPLYDCLCLIQRAKYKRVPEDLTVDLITTAWPIDNNEDGNPT